MAWHLKEHFLGIDLTNWILWKEATYKSHPSKMWWGEV